MRKMNSNWYALRWTILNRDKFTCQYCGRQAPDVILHVDHKIAKIVGGSDDESNLITACAACNIGKNLEPLGIPSIDRGIITKKKPILRELILNYLRSSAEGATGTEIATALGYQRSTVARILSKEPSFRKTKGHGRSVLYFPL